MNNEEAKEAWKKLYSEINKDNWLFVGTINPEMVSLAIKALEGPEQGELEIVDAEGWKIWNCVCTECGHDPQEYIGGTENWWLRKQHLPNFCPNCGVRIVNVKGV